MAVRRASDSGPQFCRDDGDGRGASPAVVAQKSFDDSLVRLHQRCRPMLSTQRAAGSRWACKIANQKKTAHIAVSRFGIWCWLQDLNPPPPDYKSGAIFNYIKHLARFLLRNCKKSSPREPLLSLGSLRIAKRSHRFHMQVRTKSRVDTSRQRPFGLSRRLS